MNKSSFELQERIAKIEKKYQTLKYLVLLSFFCVGSIFFVGSTALNQNSVSGETIQLTDSKGNTRVVIGKLDKAKNEWGIALFDELNIKLGEFKILNNKDTNYVGLVMANNKDDWGIRLETSDDSFEGPSISLRDSKNPSSIHLSVKYGSPNIVLGDKSSKPRAILKLFNDGKPHFSLRKKGKSAIEMGESIIQFGEKYER